jgi:hypothetical protein
MNADLEMIEKLLAKAVAMALNYRGEHRTSHQNRMMMSAANKASDALGDIRFLKTSGGE